MGIFRDLAAAAKAAEDCAVETANNVEADFIESDPWFNGVLEEEAKRELTKGFRAVGGDGDNDDSEEGEAAMASAWSSHPLPNSSSRTSIFTSGLHSSGKDIDATVPLAITNPDGPFMPLDMFISAIGEELLRSGNACDVGFVTFGHDKEFTILFALTIYMKVSFKSPLIINLSPLGSI